MSFQNVCVERCVRRAASSGSPLGLQPLIRMWHAVYWEGIILYGCTSAFTEGQK